MAKKGFIVLVVVCALLLLWMGGRATHVFETYIVPTDSNLPTMKPGTRVMASSLVKPDYGKFVCFKQPNENVWLFRCIGKPGDMVEIRDSHVFLNGKELNEPYAYNDYFITNKQLDSIRGYVAQYNYPVKPYNDSLQVISFTDAEFKTYHLHLNRYFEKKGVVNKQAFGSFQMLNYNEDNMGPLKVPANSYFLLGDNRHDAMDSRYLGFISKDDIISTVINY